MNTPLNSIRDATQSRLRLLFLHVALLVASSVSITGSAAAGILTGIGFAGSAELYSIDTSTGAATQTFTTNLFGTGLTYDSTRDVLYANGLNQLYSIDPNTGVSTAQVSLDGRTLAFDVDRDKIYTAGIQQNSGTIFEIDPTTWTVTSLGDAGIGSISAFGYNTIDQSLYAIGNQGIGGNAYFTKFNDLGNLGDQTFIAQLKDQNVEFVRALAFDPDNNRFFGAATNSPFRSLISIDPTTGLAQTIGSYGLGNGQVVGLAYRSTAPIVPEPTSLAIFGIGALCVIGVDNRRRRPTRKSLKRHYRGAFSQSRDLYSTDK